MEWTSNHDVMFCREVLVSQPFQFKSGSRERGQCWDKIATLLNSFDQPVFKVDQRALRDHLNKLMKRYSAKKAKEIKTSGIDAEVTELDVLLEEISQLQQECELNITKENEKKANIANKQKATAEAVRKQSVERYSETRKREAEENGEPSSCKKRRSGNDTVSYLREKSQVEFDLRKQELEIKRRSLKSNAREI